MKIEGNAPNQPSPTEQTRQSEKAAPTRATVGETSPAAAEDRVNLSTDARLVTEVVRAVNQAPEIRQDVVERARAKLEAGEVGADLNRLADRLIDDLLSRSS